MSTLLEGLPFEQPETFAFTPENLERAKAHIAKYPPGRQASAVLPLLWIAQEQHGWLPRAAMDHVAGILGMAPIRIPSLRSQARTTSSEPRNQHGVVVHACSR